MSLIVLRSVNVPVYFTPRYQNISPLTGNQHSAFFTRDILSLLCFSLGFVQLDLGINKLTSDSDFWISAAVADACNGQMCSDYYLDKSDLPVRFFVVADMIYGGRDLICSSLLVRSVALQVAGVGLTTAASGMT